MNIDLSKTSIDLFNIARPKDLNICCAISNKTEKRYILKILQLINKIFNKTK